jgi:hypothetical protein
LDKEKETLRCTPLHEFLVCDSCLSTSKNRINDNNSTALPYHGATIRMVSARSGLVNAIAAAIKEQSTMVQFKTSEILSPLPRMCMPSQALLRLNGLHIKGNLAVVWSLRLSKAIPVTGRGGL